MDIREFDRAVIFLPEEPTLKKIVIVPRRMIYINLAAAPDANIIRLVQGEEA